MLSEETGAQGWWSTGLTAVYQNSQWLLSLGDQHSWAGLVLLFLVPATEWFEQMHCMSSHMHTGEAWAMSLVAWIQAYPPS